MAVGEDGRAARVSVDIEAMRRSAKRRAERVEHVNHPGGAHRLARELAEDVLTLCEALQASEQRVRELEDLNVTHDPADVQERSGAWLTIRDLQHELQIGQKLAYRLVKSGTIPSVRVGGLIRIYRPQLEEALLEDPDLSKEKKG